MNSRPMSNIDIRALLGVLKHANQHRLSRLTMEVHSDELRILASAVESYTDELIAALEAAEKRIAELSSAVIAPGIMRCAGCGFVLTKNSINMVAGTITAGDSKTEPCPNGCGPLWPVTWKEQAIEMRDSSEQWFEELQEARQRIAELSASHENLREAMAGIHNTISGGGAYTPLAAVLNVSKRAYEESAAAAGKGEAS